MHAMVAMRANIAFAINIISQFMLKAASQHWMAMKHIMRYLKGTFDLKSCVKGKDIVLKGFCDVNWVGHVND